jgi:multidrug efflux pump subunit AcrA (membrane-fusion protein)
MRILVFVSLFLSFTGCGKKRESIKPHYENMVEAVYASATILPEQYYKVNASISGYLEEVYIREGDFVKKGDLLFVISNKPIRLNEENTELAYQFLKDSYSGKANLIDELKLNLGSSQVKMQNDSLNYSRYLELDKKNACSKFELDNSKVIYQMSKNSYLGLKQQIVRKEIELKNQLSQSRNNLSLSSLRTDDYFIRSNIDGKIFQVNKEKGEMVSLQEPMAIIGDQNHYAIEMLIDEVDISKVELGQKVLITLEAYKNHVYEAVLTEISPKMDEKNQTFKIKARFIKAPKKLYMGLTGEANIVVKEGVKSLVIPADFLLPGNMVETESGKVKVGIGHTNWDYVEVLSGLKENTVILKPEK